MSIEDAITRPMKKITSEAEPTRVIEKKLEQRAPESGTLASPETVSRIDGVKTRIDALADYHNWRPETANELRNLLEDVHSFNDLDPAVEQGLRNRISSLRRDVMSYQATLKDIGRSMEVQFERGQSVGAGRAAGAGGWWKKIFGR